MIYYETDRLILRNVQPSDVNDYYEYMSLEFTALHNDFDPYTLEMCENAAVKRQNDDRFWVVQLKESGKVIGSLKHWQESHGTYGIGYEIHEKYGGKGYATESCNVLIRHLFEVENARRISAGVNEDNVSSWRLLERLGFRREAHCIEDAAFKNDAEGNPVYVNSYYYALLKREWQMEAI